LEVNVYMYTVVMNIIIYSDIGNSFLDRCKRDRQNRQDETVGTCRSLGVPKIDVDDFTKK